MRATGKSIEYLRETPICQIRKDIEAETGRKMRVYPAYREPFSREEVDKIVRKALK